MLPAIAVADVTEVGVVGAWWTWGPSFSWCLAAAGQNRCDLVVEGPELEWSKSGAWSPSVLAAQFDPDDGDCLGCGYCSVVYLHCRCSDLRCHHRRRPHRFHRYCHCHHSRAAKRYLEPAPIASASDHVWPLMLAQGRTPD